MSHRFQSIRLWDAAVVVGVWLDARIPVCTQVALPSVKYGVDGGDWFCNMNEAEKEDTIRAYTT